MTQPFIICVLQQQVDKMPYLTFVIQALQHVVFIVFKSLKISSFGSESSRRPHG